RARALHDGDLRLLLGGGLNARRVAGHAEIDGLVRLVAAGDDGEKGNAEKAADGHSIHVTSTPAIRLRLRRASLSELVSRAFSRPLAMVYSSDAAKNRLSNETARRISERPFREPAGHAFASPTIPRTCERGLCFDPGRG